ncbi:MAG: hypothetical protein PHG06_00030 [Parabacteroides sp.]|nr:hypothetical protein [Parabacteroides sp.]
MKLEINPWLSHTITVLAIVLLVGFAVYITKSIWCLLGLVFIPGLKIHEKDPPENDEGK